MDIAAAKKRCEARPIVVCLCGSTRFKDVWLKETKELTMAGQIVLSAGGFPHADGFSLTTEEKAAVDELHKRKIDLADWVYVLSVNGYIGESTRSEIEYAEQQGKPIHYWSPHDRPIHLERTNSDLPAALEALEEAQGKLEAVGKRMDKAWSEELKHKQENWGVRHLHTDISAILRGSKEDE